MSRDWSAVSLCGACLAGGSALASYGLFKIVGSDSFLGDSEAQRRAEIAGIVFAVFSSVFAISSLYASYRAPLSAGCAFLHLGIVFGSFLATQSLRDESSSSGFSSFQMLTILHCVVPLMTVTRAAADVFGWFAGRRIPKVARHIFSFLL